MSFIESFGMKELYDVHLKTTSNLEVGDRTFLTGETVLHFDTLQLVLINEQKTSIAAKGGFGNSVLVNWENTNGVIFSCENGIASKTTMAILSNSKLTDGATVNVNYSETIESTILGVITLKYTPIASNFFIYDEDMVPVTSGYVLTGKVITGLTQYKDYTIRYLFTYTGDASVLNIGQRLLNGYLKLTAKMRLKDDTTGLINTGILEIPTVRLMSNLSIRLGENIVPAVSIFRLQGDPVGERNSRYVCQFIYLNSDIDADI